MASGSLQSLNSMLAIREVNKWPNKYNYTNVLKENLPYIPQKNRRDMIKTWAYPKQWTPRSSSDGQRYSRTELRVLLFQYCTVIFMHSKLDSKEPIPLQTTQPCFYSWFKLEKWSLLREQRFALAYPPASKAS